MKKIYSFLLLITFLVSSVNAQQLTGYKLCIDPGHGGHDAANDRQIFLPNGIIYWESEGVLETAFHLKKMLSGLGANVLMTRTANNDADDIGLSARSTIANNFGADYFHSVHTNAANATANYTLVLFKGTTDAPDFSAAKQMSDLMSPIIYSTMKTTTSYSRGDMTFLGYNLGVLKGASMPSTLSEGSFHDVPLEGLRLKSSHYLKNYAWAIAKSFTSFYGKTGFVSGRVGGIVSDDFDNSAINNVKVSVTTNDSVCYTDNNYNGFYGLDLLPGNYTLTFSKEGYVSKDVQVTISANTYTGLDTKIIYLNDGKPRADFVVSGLPAGAGAQISFNGSKSVDIDGSIALYEWDFGDGATATGVSATHTYTADNTYNVKLTVTDNESKTASITKQISIQTAPPSAPVFNSIVNTENNSVKFTWTLSSTSNAAYRIYQSNSDALNDFSVLVNENALPSGTSQFTYNDLPSNTNGYNFKLIAVNGAGESTATDVYSILNLANVEGAKKVLVVDGYDRLGSWGKATHSFANTYMATLRNYGNAHVSSAANEAITKGAVSLLDYDLVVWFVGDESTADETFSDAEQVLVKAYLENGGNLLVSGSEIGWDLSTKGSTTDKDFYANYLKTTFENDGGSGRNPASGITGTAFEGVSLNFGQVYAEDYPDEITAGTGAQNILKYANNQYSGVAYKGIFGTSAKNGGLVYVSFPIESVSDKSAINTFFTKAMSYFFTTTSVESIDNKLNASIFPNPVQSILNIKIPQNIESNVQISIYDFSGKNISTQQMDKIVENQNITINVSDLSSGFYILKIQSKDLTYSSKFIKE